MCILSLTEYEYENIPNIHLTSKEPTWDPLTNEYSERETHISDHQGQISIPAKAARGPVCVNAVVSYSQAYDSTNVLDNDNFATALSDQIHISIVLIDTVRNPQ